MRHLLGLEGLSKEEIYRYLNNSKEMVEIADRDVKKVPALRGKTIVNLFFEASTRTRTSFEIAGKRLSADVINVSSSGSSISKGETLLDTARNIAAMAPDILVVRHASSGAPHFLAGHLKNTSVVNAGDGMHEHPTQGLLDCLTLIQHFAGRAEGIEKLKVAIVGDILHSRVARSNVWAHLQLGNEVRLVGPRTLVPDEFGLEAVFPRAGRCSSEGSVKVYHDLVAGLTGVDVIICLRMQLERMQNNFVPNLEEYCNEYCISERLLKRYCPDCVVMHPGPVNRGTEISTEVVDGPRSLVTRQVANGVAVRMGVLFSVLAGNTEKGMEHVAS